MTAILTDLLVIVILIGGIAGFRTPAAARRGNVLAATAMGLAVLLVLQRHGFLSPLPVAAGIMVGSALGWLVARRVNMIQIPAMVAFQHGAGGVAAFLVASIELHRQPAGAGAAGALSGLLGIVLGAATCSASMIASAKLANWLSSKPTQLPAHGVILGALCLFTAAFGISSFESGTLGAWEVSLILIGASMLVGILFSVRIGGADMPVLISFLNASAGLAAALCGIVIGNRLLIACGATVAASGSVLTHVMCKAMNRSFLKVLHGLDATEGGGAAPPESAQTRAPTSAERPVLSRQESLDRAARVLRAANRVVIIPGYGMALAQAQLKVVELARLLEAGGKDVKYAIHPVAGRMPGHMNVLLAEAEVDYDKLFEMEAINPELAECDVVLVVGACDVVNPAAISASGTPISGMPILRVHEARNVIVCNLDERPGYSGVANPLYQDGKTILLWGDASDTLSELIAASSPA